MNYKRGYFQCCLVWECLLFKKTIMPYHSIRVDALNRQNLDVCITLRKCAFKTKALL